jgi:U3 small nucleolar RNA-associated protein 12
MVSNLCIFQEEMFCISFFYKFLILHGVILETGLFRLLGHSAPISDLSFVPKHKELAHFHGLITSSMDGLVKVWDLNSQCCVQTIANHGGQVLCSTVVLLPSSTDSVKGGGTESQNDNARCRLVTGCIDGKVRIYSVHKSKRMMREKVLENQKENTCDMNTDVDVVDSEDDDICTYMGMLPPPINSIASNEKVVALEFHPSGNYIGFLRSNSKTIDIYAVRSVEESLQKRRRRLRRRREKENKSKQKEDTSYVQRSTKRGLLDDDDEEEEQQQQNDGDRMKIDEPFIRDLEQVQASDEFEYVSSIRASHKIKGFKFAPYMEKKGGIRVVCALGTNALEVHSMAKNHSESNEQYTTQVVSSLDMYGHPTGIRSIALSSDDILACTVSKNIAKIWNVGNRSCLRSLPLASVSSKKQGSYGLCSVFLPGDTHVVIGTREGYLMIVDIASGEIVYTEKAHDKEIWSIGIKNPTAHNPDDRITLVTGSADRTVKFWEVESQEEGSDDEVSSHVGQPMVVHTRTLESSDDVIAVRYSYSNEKRLVIVSTLDCLIKVFFDDTLKFFLSLYGHTLPALALDASDDDTILASGGADKSIKIWGLDFGDTHRTLYGHSDSITDLKFVRKTHNFFTSSKDGTIRYWDADRFEQILLLNGHISEVNCLTVAKSGAYILSGAMDRQIRVWERTKDMVFLEEEKERALEDMFDKVDNRGDEVGTERIMRRQREEEAQEEDDDENEPQSAEAVKRSVLSIAAGDRIMEALERADQETKEVAAFRKNQEGIGAGAKRRTPNPLLLGMEPPMYILWVLRSIKCAELEQSLLVLPLNYMERLIYYLIVLLRNGHGIELCGRCAIFLVKTHQKQLVGHDKLSVPLGELRRLLKQRLAEVRDTVGYNLAAIRMVQKLSNEYKNRYHVPDEGFQKDVFKGLGLGSELAETLQRKK